MATTLYERQGGFEYQYSVGGTTINCSGTIRLKVTTPDSELRAGSTLNIEAYAHDSGGNYNGTQYYDLYAWVTTYGDIEKVTLTTDPNGGKTYRGTFTRTYNPLPNQSTRDIAISVYCYGTYTPVGISELEYIPNTAPSVTISPPSQIYAGATMPVTVRVSDYDGDSCNGSLTAVYVVGSTTRRVVVSSNIHLGNSTVNVQIPSDYVNGKVSFEATVTDAYGAVGTANTSQKTILYNNPPSAVFNITGVAPGNTATIAWVYTDLEGHNVLTSSLTRYYQAKNNIAKAIMAEIVKKYPQYDGKMEILDTWTPYTYASRNNDTNGSYMRFITTAVSRKANIFSYAKENILIMNYIFIFL